MSKFKTVIYQASNGIATIKLNRPEARNAFTQQMRQELLAAIKQANADDEVRVVVLTGEGKVFSAGADLKAGLEGFNRIGDQIIQEYQPIIEAIDQAEKLYIAVINGAAAGIGGALAMVCDLAVIADDGFIYQAFAAIGLVPDGGSSYHLVHRLGYRRALEMIVQAEKMGAEDCLKYGLVNKVVPADALLAEAQDWAAALAQGSPLSQKNAKKLLKLAQSADLMSVIEAEAEVQNDLFVSEDFINATKAFFNKQKPVFKGK